MRSGALLALVFLLAGGCAATHQPASRPSIGPFTEFTGRLIVIDASHRWQVAVDWNGDPMHGDARLTHAASNRIIRISWQGDEIRMLDNLDQGQLWRDITPQELRTHGIILPPPQLARILTGDIPESLQRKNGDEWEGTIDGDHVRIKWNDQSRRLELADVTHGHKAILIIEP